MFVNLTIEGTPVAKSRPRFTRTGRVYTDAKTKAAEQAIRSAWLTQVGSRKPHTGPVSMTLIAMFEPPKSWPKWQRELAQSTNLPHNTKPDFDNLAKIVDALNGLAWIDDSQLDMVLIRKCYGRKAKTEIKLEFRPAATTTKENQ